MENKSDTLEYRKAKTIYILHNISRLLWLALVLYTICNLILLGKQSYMDVNLSFFLIAIVIWFLVVVRLLINEIFTQVIVRSPSIYSEFYILCSNSSATFSKWLLPPCYPANQKYSDKKEPLCANNNYRRKKLWIAVAIIPVMIFSAFFIATTSSKIHIIYSNSIKAEGFCIAEDYTLEFSYPYDSKAMAIGYSRTHSGEFSRPDNNLFLDSVLSIEQFTNERLAGQLRIPIQKYIISSDNDKQEYQCLLSKSGKIYTTAKYDKNAQFIVDPAEIVKLFSSENIVRTELLNSKECEVYTVDTRSEYLQRFMYKELDRYIRFNDLAAAYSNLEFAYGELTDINNFLKDVSSRQIDEPSSGLLCSMWVAKESGQILRINVIGTDFAAEILNDIFSESISGVDRSGVLVSAFELDCSYSEYGKKDIILPAEYAVQSKTK